MRGSRGCLPFPNSPSECLALRWSDVDWLNGKLRIERGIVHQVVDDVKTAESNREMYIDALILQGLKDWKQLTQLSGPDDWMFASRRKSDVCQSPIRESGGRFEPQRPRLAWVTSVRIRSATPTGRGWMRSELPLVCNKNSCAMRTSEPRCNMGLRRRRICSKHIAKSFDLPCPLFNGR